MAIATTGLAQAPTEATGASSGTPPLAVTPPRLVHAPPPQYPDGESQQGAHPTVMLEVVLDADGQLRSASVEHSAGREFDRAAQKAVQGWKFLPATRDGAPIASRVHVAVHFELPAFDLATSEAGASAMSRRSHPPVHMVQDPAHLKHTSPKGGQYRTTAEVEPTPLRHTRRSSGDLQLSTDVLHAAPRSDAGDMLRLAPGLFAAKPEGDAVAHGLMWRGFDAEHGQDVEIVAGGVPVNLPSHIHGQGYADLGFLIPEVVHGMRVTEGVHDPSQGDFAVAGSIDVTLGVEERGIYLKSGYGSYDTFRQLALWAPINEARDTFGAVQYRRTDGFGQNRAGQSGSGIVQGAFGHGRWRYRALGIAHGAHAKMAGVLRDDDIAADNVGFYDVYPFPTAQAQQALAGRMIAAINAEYRGSEGDNAETGAWVSMDQFRLRENFSGFLERFSLRPDDSPPGDLIEQQNQVMSMGLKGRYRTAPYRPVSWAKGTMELGIASRLDVIDQSQTLLDAAHGNQAWETRNDADMRILDLGAWGDVDWQLGRFLSVRGGLRADALYYDIHDHLGVPATFGEPYLSGARRSAVGIALGPRASIEAALMPWLTVLGAYGQGYRSAQALTLTDGEHAPFTKVHSADLGARFHWRKALEVVVSGFYTHLSDDLAFDAHEGRLERIGPSRRVGGMAYGLVRPATWLLFAASLTYVDAKLLSAATNAEDPSTPPTTRDVPYVPPLVVRIDAAAEGKLPYRLLGDVLFGHAGLGISGLSSRPLPYAGSSAPFTLIDAKGSLRWRNLEAGIELLNVLNSRYAAFAYNFSSQWDPSGPQETPPARHITAGAPRTVMVTLGVHL